MNEGLFTIFADIFICMYIYIWCMYVQRISRHFYIMNIYILDLSLCFFLTIYMCVLDSILHILISGFWFSEFWFSIFIICIFDFWFSDFLTYGLRLCRVTRGGFFSVSAGIPHEYTFNLGILPRAAVAGRHPPQGKDPRPAHESLKRQIAAPAEPASHNPLTMLPPSDVFFLFWILLGPTQSSGQ